MKLSITTKVLCFSFAIIIISCLSTLLTSTVLLEKPLLQEINSSLFSMQRIIDQEQKQIESKFLAIAELIASQTDLINAITSKDIAKVQTLGQHWMKNSEADFVTITNEKGIVVGRGHSSKTGDPVLNQETVVNALAGKGSVGLVSGTVEPYTIRAGYPLKQDQKVVGTVNIGVSLTNPRFVDAFKKVLDLEMTIFKNTERVMTTIFIDGKRVIGTQLQDQKVIEAVIKKGLTYQGSTAILGIDYNTIYWPIRGMEGQILGIYFLGKPVSALLAGQQRATMISLGVSGLIAIVLLGLSVFVALTFTSPLKKATAFAEDIAKGNLSSQLPVYTQDEIGVLAEALRTMVAQLKERLGFTQGIMTGIEAPLLVTDRAGQVTYANTHFIQYAGLDCSVEKLYGRTVSDIFYGEVDRDICMTQALKEKQPIVDVPLSWFNYKNEKKHMLMSAVPLWDLDKNLIGCFMLISDMTAVKKQQERVMALNEHISLSTQKAQKISKDQAQTFTTLAEQIHKSTEAALLQQQASSVMASDIVTLRNTLDNLVTRARETTKHTRHSRDEASAGAVIVQQTIDGINRVADFSNRMEEAMQILSDKAANITHVVELIKDVADQTNLLALNAAIEAARAGESGRGFAVVADEVRKLAEKTMNATAEVNISISALQQQVNTSLELTQQSVQVTAYSTELAKQSGESLNQIVKIADNTVIEVDTIASATVEQSIKSAEMAKSIEHISKMAQDSAQNMQESSDMVQELSGLSDSLKNLIDSMGAERRQSDRLPVDFAYIVEVKINKSNEIIPCRLINITTRGLSLELPNEKFQLSPGTLVTIKGNNSPLHELLNNVRGSIQWRGDIFCGIELETILNVSLEWLQKAVSSSHTRLTK